jgi:hypothetical protein
MKLVALSDGFRGFSSVDEKRTAMPESRMRGIDQIISLDAADIVVSRC